MQNYHHTSNFRPQAMRDRGPGQRRFADFCETLYYHCMVKDMSVFIGGRFAEGVDVIPQLQLQV